MGFQSIQYKYNTKYKNKTIIQVNNHELCIYKSVVSNCKELCVFLTRQQEKPKIFAKDTEINHEVVFKKLTEFISARGKKGTDRNVQIEMLMELREIAKAHNLGDATDCRMLFEIISAVFDYNPNIATSMKEEMWDKYVVC